MLVDESYSTTKREYLAMVFNVKNFQHYFLFNAVVLFVDHLALQYMVYKPNLSGPVVRWILLLEDLDYTKQYNPGRLHKHVDHLSRLSKEVGTVDIDDELLDDNLFLITIIPSWYVYIVEFLSIQKMLEGLGKNE